MKKDVDPALNDHERNVAKDFGGVSQDFVAIRKEVADLRSKTTRLQAHLGRHRTDIDRNRDSVDSVEASFNDLETVLRVSEQNLAIALRGRCRCTDKALEDLELSFVDDPAPGLTRTGSSLSYLTIPNTSTLEPEELGAPLENLIPVPIREPSIPTVSVEGNVESSLLQAQEDEIKEDIARSFGRPPHSRSAAAQHRVTLHAQAP